MKKKNLAIIGYGGMGGWHAIMARQSDVVNLRGVYDINPDQYNVRPLSPGEIAYPSLEAVLNDPEVDLVTIAVPNDCHKDITIKALEHGKAVICEKPVALNSEELDEMVAASERTGSLFTVHQNRRWDTDILAIKDLVKDGTIGNIISVESRVHGSRGIPGDWRQEKAHGGGMVLDWGVHLIDQALFTFPGNVTSIYARMDHIRNKEVDDGCHIVMTFESGVVYTVEVGTCNYITLPRFYVRGENGTAVIREWNEPMEVTVMRLEEEHDATPIRAQTGITKTMAPRTKETIENLVIPMPESDVHDFYRNVCRAIDGLEPQLITHPQLRRVMKIMETSFESAERNEVIHGVF
ncbi:MAG: Gfo/Idh/MocA family oxidoreductase [Clostridia bacterium]|nr:Gfo/Idh/MocA family oxidoreductase [Clostridia bacterium]